MRFAVLAVALTGCISIPGFHGSDGGSDGGTGDTPTIDAPIGPLAVRFIANAYREGGPDSMAQGTFGMSETGYAVLTNGVVAGDLMLLIGNIDNGANNLWNLPTGFTQVVQREYGQDGQTYLIAWKIATGSEPVQISGTYNMAVSSSHAATVSLLAITGYDPANPIEAFLPTDHQTATDPADVGSTGIVTTVDNSLLIYAAGADWTPNNGTNAASLPSDYTLVTSIADRDTHWDWTSQVIGSAYKAQAGATGALTNTLTGINFSDGTTHIPGGGWAVLLAITPHP